MFGSFLPSLQSSINYSLLGARSRHCYAITDVCREQSANPEARDPTGTGCKPIDSPLPEPGLHEPAPLLQLGLARGGAHFDVRGSSTLVLALSEPIHLGR